MPEGTGPRAVVVACDPVDGSSNLDVGGSVGTIFSIRAGRGAQPAGPAALGTVDNQLAAGYVISRAQPVATMQTWPLAARAGVEARGVSGPRERG